jgi:uncharacterized membrane protein HdeD (DUF308 family)
MEQTTAEYRNIEYEGLQVPWWVVVLEGIISILLGIFLLFEPVGTTILLVQILGIFWFLGGVLTILTLLVDRENMGWKLLSGLIGILIGVIVFIYPNTPFVVLGFFVIILGILSIFYGVLRLVWALKGGGLGIAILGIITIVLGILLLANPLVGAVVLPWIYGISLAIGGIAALILGIRIRSQ